MNSARVLTGIAVMAATIMQVLDTTIVNVALPNMAGQLDATPDNISWVLTSYLIASAIFMPLTGFFTDRIGQKRFLLISIAGFVITSALCGMATSALRRWCCSASCKACSVRRWCRCRNPSCCRYFPANSAARRWRSGRWA